MCGKQVHRSRALPPSVGADFTTPFKLQGTGRAIHRALKDCVSDGIHEGGARKFRHTLGELKARPYPPDHDDVGGGFAAEWHSSELRNGLLE